MPRVRRPVFASLLALASCRGAGETAATTDAAPSAPDVALRAPRYVLVDGGAHLGETILAFEKSTLATKHPWEIVSFEPNPTLVPQLPKRPNLTVRAEAIWTKDEELSFRFPEQDSTGGSVVGSFIARKPHWKEVRVHAIDFGAWLRATYAKEDVVHVKFDIEGAEYPVLEQMLRDGSMALVDKLYVEFHGVQQAQGGDASAPEIAAIERKDRELVEAITGLGVAVRLHTTNEAPGSYFDFDPEKYGQTW